MPINAKQATNEIEKNILFAGEMFKKVKKNIPVLQKEVQTTDPEDGLSSLRITDLLTEMADQIDTWEEALQEAASAIEGLAVLYDYKSHQGGQTQ
ncbi:hypothetical protein [uncultured Dubosiella sp.]|uniref:hypothetical protein n=1 Tax=uncultured Dubosiella sp. TaxID=1937011 RepID=UPI00272F99D5|nr:hypothetical protein [uncultured Dubosiella sp.]